MATTVPESSTPDKATLKDVSQATSRSRRKGNFGGGLRWYRRHRQQRSVQLPLANFGQVTSSAAEMDVGIPAAARAGALRLAYQRWRPADQDRDAQYSAVQALFCQDTSLRAGQPLVGFSSWGTA